MAPACVLAALFTSVFLYAGCNFNAAPEKSSTSSKTPTTVSFKKEDLPCPSIVRKLPNLELKDISTDAVPYLARYSLPAADGVAFCRYLERIQHDHEVKIEEGLVDMMGDYFLATQKIETGYFFSYKVRNREIPKIIRDGASSESEQADLFLKAIDSDPDAARKALLEKQIKDLSSSNRKEGVLKLIQFLFKESWAFNPTVQQYLASENYHDDSYGFVDRGLRTTSYSHMGATVELFLNSDITGFPPEYKSTLEAARKRLPEKAKRILILGPGLDFSNPELGEEIPQQSYEPFAIMDLLLKSKRSDFEDIKIDLFDISPRVEQHWEGLLKSANQGHAYRLTLVVGGNRLSDEISYVTHFGDSLPGVSSSEISRKESRRPAPRTLDPDSVSVRSLTIPASVVKKFHPFQGDLTTTDLEKLALENGGKYDVIFCFNTMEYLNETERALAGINIRESLAENGVFITDNRFETDLGERPKQPRKDTSAAKPIFEPAFFEMVTDVINASRHMVIYRKGQK
ncbi:MAG: hypothetical protein DMG13_14000 [Acidobacteria bacterium]|nr:MAG: hypothetical protein DMG13_14000 [Acidobacteriota bacterium]